jgi:hypothetical protein
MKLRAARERKREKTGRCEGRKGYAEAVPETVAEARRLRVEGKSYRARRSGKIKPLKSAPPEAPEGGLSDLVEHPRSHARRDGTVEPVRYGDGLQG